MTMQQSSRVWTISNPFARRSVQPVTGRPGPWDGLATESDPITIWLQWARVVRLQDCASSPHLSVPKLRILRWPRGLPILSEVAPGGVEKADISLSCNEIK